MAKKEHRGGKYNWRAHFCLTDNKFDEENLRRWYEFFSSGGSSSPDSRIICALIEELAELKGIDLTKQASMVE